MSHTVINTHCGHFWLWNLISEVLNHQVNISQKNIAALIDTINKRVEGSGGNILLLQVTTSFFITTKIYLEKKLLSLLREIISSFCVAMATFTKYEKEKWIKQKNNFAGRFGTNKIEIFQNQVHFHLKMILKRKLKLSQHPGFFSLQ